MKFSGHLLVFIIVAALLFSISCSSDNDSGSTDGDVDIVDGEINDTDGDQEIDIDSDSVDKDSENENDIELADVENDTESDLDKDGEDDIELTDKDSEQDTETVALTWTDAVTKLMWQMAVTGREMHFDTAETHCENLVLDGYSDWRLPNISELRTLIRDCANTEIGGACGAKDECSACGVSNEDICLADSCWNDSCSGCVVNGGLANGCYWPSELDGICS